MFELACADGKFFGDAAVEAPLRTVGGRAGPVNRHALRALELIAVHRNQHRAVAGLDAHALVGAEAGVFPGADVLDDLGRDLAACQQQAENLLCEEFAERLGGDGGQRVERARCVKRAVGDERMDVRMPAPKAFGASG